MEIFSKIIKLFRTDNGNQFDNFKIDFEELDNEIKKLDDENKKLKKDIETHNNDLETFIINNNKAINDFKSKIKKLNKKIRNIRESSMIEINLLKNEIQDNKQIISSLELEIKDLEVHNLKFNEEIEEKRKVIAKLNSILNYKDLEFKKLEDDFIKKLDIRAEDISKMGLQNKSDESQLNDYLPMSSEISNLYEEYINRIDNYIINSKFDNLSNKEIALIIKEIFETSFKYCMDDFKNSFKLKTINKNKLYNLRCLINSEKDEFIDYSYTQTSNLLKTILNKYHKQNEIALANKFIKECCNFIWTVILSQPEVKFIYPNSLNDTIFSQDKHISLGPNNSSNKTQVDFIIIPSIYLNRDGSLLTKSYVMIKENIKTQIKETLSHTIAPELDIQSQTTVQQFERNSFKNNSSSNNYTEKIESNNNPKLDFSDNESNKGSNKKQNDLKSSENTQSFSIDQPIFQTRNKELDGSKINITNGDIQEKDESNNSLTCENVSNIKEQMGLESNQNTHSSHINSKKNKLEDSNVKKIKNSDEMEIDCVFCDRSLSSHQDYSDPSFYQFSPNAYTKTECSFCKL